MAAKNSYAQKAYNAIKEDIVSQKLKPGSFISEAEYADKIGVSRTPVREALKTLEREGLIDIFPRKGVQVKSYTLEDIRQIHEAGEAMERVLMGLVAKQSADGLLPRAEVAALRDLLERMDECLAENDVQGWIAWDHQFHLKLISLCDNHYITQYATASRYRVNQILWFITPKYADRGESTYDHRLIVDAIEKGDPDAASQAISTHFLRVHKALIKVVGAL